MMIAGSKLVPGKRDVEEARDLGLMKPRRVSSWSSMSSGLSNASTSATETQSEGHDVSRSEASLIGNVWTLSQDAVGCRQVQEALDWAPSDETRAALAEELHGRVARAMRHPHANHVLQKCISTMPAASLQFILDELLEREDVVVHAARHRYACRVVQQTLQKFGPARAGKLVEILLQNIVMLACHTFGKYGIAHLLKVSTDEQRYLAVREIEKNMGTICQSPHGVVVVAAAMEHAAFEDKVWIARAAIQDVELLTQISQYRDGCAVVISVLHALSGREHTRACMYLLRDVAVLRLSTFGQDVVEYLETQMRSTMHEQQVSI